MFLWPKSISVCVGGACLSCRVRVPFCVAGSDSGKRGQCRVSLPPR